LAPFVSGGSLDGFEISPLSLPMATIRYKKWAAASVKLDGFAGKTVRLNFRTSDCTLGGHFGYAYLDIESGCDGKIAGSTFCSADPFVNLTAPAGFAGYRWFNTSNITLGNQQVLTLNPLPHSGEVVYVELTPYHGYGCVDTLTAYLWDTLTVVANAGPDKEFCVNSVVQLGGAPKPGLIYTWLPTTGLSEANISNPVVTPNANIQYTLRASSVGGGCQSTDAVNLVKKCDIIEFYVPNAFAPGSNTANNRLRPFLYGFSKVNYFRVYNRFGQLLYNASSDTPGWDGTYKGKVQFTQTVIWMIEAVDAYGRIERRQGTSILLR
jgi:gliding motility-associated-like protein